MNKEYQQSKDKITYFMNLDDSNKKDLFENLERTEQDRLLEILPFQYLKNFIAIYPKEEQKNIYKRLSTNQKRAIYNNLNEDEKKEMANSLEEGQVDLLERIEDAREQMKQSMNSIKESNQQIATSIMNLANTKIELQNQKQNLHDAKIQIKKIDKARKKQLKKVIKASKPSILDRVSIISKLRTKKLLKRSQELEQLNIEKMSLEDFRRQTNQNIENAEKTIQKEQENIKNAKNQILEDKKNIQANAKRISRTEVKIRKCEKEEKRILGRKLYRKQINTRESIIERRKEQKEIIQSKESSSLNQENILEHSEWITNINPSIEYAWQEVPTTEKEKPKDNILEYGKLVTNLDPTKGYTWNHLDKEKADKIEHVEVEAANTPKVDTTQLISSLLNTTNQLQSMGVNFFPPTIEPNSVQQSSILDTPITTINQKELIIAAYAMTAVYLYAMQQTLQNQQSQEQTVGYSRGLSPNNRGSVNLALLVGILLFIMSIFLFITR